MIGRLPARREPLREFTIVGSQPTRPMERGHRHRLVSLVRPFPPDDLGGEDALGIAIEELGLPLRREPRFQAVERALNFPD